MIKPVITKEDISLVWDAEDGTGYQAGEDILEKLRIVNQPLYAIPEGYHITPIKPITPDQAMISNIELHNEPLRDET